MGKEEALEKRITTGYWSPASSSVDESEDNPSKSKQTADHNNTTSKISVKPTTATTATTTMVPVLPDNKKPAESKQTAADNKTCKISVKPMTTTSGNGSISVSGLLPSTEEDNPIKTVETLTNKINTESVEN